jgi:hypothetical protein
MITSSARLCSARLMTNGKILATIGDENPIFNTFDVEGNSGMHRARRGREGSVSARASKYQLIPNMPEHRLRPPIERFTELLAQQPVFVEMFGAVPE